LRVRLSEFYFIGDRIDYEEEISFVDDIAVLKMDLRQCASHLRAKFHLVESGELSKEAESRLEVQLKRLANRYG
jgi:hypothetical protein